MIAHDESVRNGHDERKLSDAPAVWHCRSRLVQMPPAHCSPSAHVVPSATWLSAGQVALVPLHVSAVSQRGSTAGRQTCVAGARRQDDVQQAELDGSQTEPDVNLQVVGLQQLDCWPPGSQSSPGSTMPLPHC